MALYVQGQDSVEQLQAGAQDVICVSGSRVDYAEWEGGGGQPHGGFAIDRYFRLHFNAQTYGCGRYDVFTGSDLGKWWYLQTKLDDAVPCVFLTGHSEGKK